MSNKITKIGVIMLVVAVPVLISLLVLVAGSNANAEDPASLPLSDVSDNPYANLQQIYASGNTYPGGMPTWGEITEEQRLNMERLTNMPYGKMNPDIWIKITSQMSCLITTKQVTGNKIEDAKMAEMAKPFGVTGEEYMAFYLQMMAGKIDFSQFKGYDPETYLEKMQKEYDDMTKSNCERGVEEKPEIPETKLVPKMTEDVWFEITARIRCLDRIMLAFTKYEIGTIFTPFGVTSAEYVVYNESMLKKIEMIVAKDTGDWTIDEQAFIEKYKQFKVRLENLKKNNCKLDDGTVISEEYNNFAEPEGWDKTKCKLFSCNNCYGVNEGSSFWEKYRCKNLCSGCAIGTPPVKVVESCSGFCSEGNCPDSADKVSGICATQKVCTRCGLFKMYKCCKEKEAVCCQTKPAEVCANTCSLKNCPKGMESSGTKDCPSGKEKYKCGLWKMFTCKRDVSGVCCK